MTNIIPNKSAASMIKARNNGKELTLEQEALLEYWYWHKRPTQNAMSLVDDVCAYLPDYPEVTIGLVHPAEDYDCYVCGNNGILYKGNFLSESSFGGLRWCMLTVDPTCREKIKKAWKGH